jgi:DNA primase
VPAASSNRARPGAPVCEPLFWRRPSHIGGSFAKFLTSLPPCC